MKGAVKMAEMKVKKVADRGVVVENPMPYDPEAGQLSKADFVAKQKSLREKELKIREFSKTLDKPKVAEEAKTETPKVNKPKGRPKKIE